MYQFSPAKYMVNSNSIQNFHNFFILSHATPLYQTCFNCTPVTHAINHRRGKIMFASAHLWWPLDHKYLMFPSMVYIYRLQLTLVSWLMWLNPHFLLISCNIWDPRDCNAVYVAIKKNIVILNYYSLFKFLFLWPNRQLTSKCYWSFNTVQPQNGFALLIKKSLLSCTEMWLQFEDHLPQAYVYCKKCVLKQVAKKYVKKYVVCEPTTVNKTKITGVLFIQEKTILVFVLQNTI